MIMFILLGFAGAAIRICHRPSSLLAAVRLDLDSNPIAHLTICMIGAGGFIDS